LSSAGIQGPANGNLLICIGRGETNKARSERRRIKGMEGSNKKLKFRSKVSTQKENT
jgi:hypothetical protein